LQDFDKAILQEPNNAHTYINRGIAKLLLKYYYSAIEDCVAAIKIDSKIEGSYLCRAGAYFGLEKYDDALADYRKALNLNTFSAETHTRIGMVQVETKDTSEALNSYNKALELDSLFSFAFYNRGNLWLEMKEYDLAHADYNRVIELDPNNALTYFNRAILKSNTKDFSGAVEDYDKAIELNPKNILTYFNRAGVKFNMNNYRGALVDYSKAIEIFPDFADAYFNRSLVKRSMNNYIGAKEDFELAQAISENNYNNPTSDEEFAKLIELDAKFNADFYNKDYLQNQMANIDIEPKFVVSFTYGDEIRNSDYFYNPLNVYNKKYENDTEFIIQKNEEKLDPDDIYTLISVLTKNIEDNPDKAYFYFNRAVFRGRIEDYNGALEDYDKAIELQSNFALAYFNRANIRVDLIELIESFDDEYGQMPDERLRENENYKMVLADYDKSISLDPDFVFAFYNRANFNLRIKEIDKAIEDYEIAVELNPRLAEPYFNRGLVYLYKEERKTGCLDIGKAGEMGLTKSYNIIKRFCN